MKLIKNNAILFGMVLTATFCGSCSSQKPKATENPVTAAATEIPAIQGYFLKNTYHFDQDMAFFVFKDQASFDNYMNIGRTMSNSPSLPSFSENIIAAVAAKPTDMQTVIKIIKIETQGDKASVYFEANPGEKLSYSATPQILFSFPKTTGLKNVEFITGGKTVKTISLDHWKNSGMP